MPDRETSRLLDAVAVALARYQYELEQLRNQPAEPAPPDDTTGGNMRKILDHLEAHPDGLTRGAIMTDLAFEDGRAGRTAWDQLKARKLITDRTPFQATPAGEDWFP